MKRIVLNTIAFVLMVEALMRLLWQCATRLPASAASLLISISPPGDEAVYTTYGICSFVVAIIVSASVLFVINKALKKYLLSS